MMTQGVKDTIKSAIKMGDFSSLYDYFADDVHLSIAMAVSSPVVSNERCKQSAIDCLRKLGDIELPSNREAPEFFANGDRVVAYWDESVSLRSGVAIRSQCTLVFDFDKGLISRLAIHHDLSSAWESTPESGDLPAAPMAAPVVKPRHRNRAVEPRAG